jgi:hypothetical protein
VTAVNLSTPSTTPETQPQPSSSEPAPSSTPTQEFTSSISLENPSNALPTSINTVTVSSLGVPSSVSLPDSSVSALTPPSSGALPSSIGSVNVSSLSVPGGALPGTVTGAKPVGGAGGSSSGDVSTLGAWEDFLVWWAEQTEKAKNLQDEEAKNVRAQAQAMADKTGDYNYVLNANAFLANRNAIAQANGCSSPMNCNTPEMRDFRQLTKNIAGLSPGEQLKIQRRVALNVYKFAVEDNSGCSNCRGGLSSVLKNLVKSTAAGKKNGATTADEMWGNSYGFDLTDDQYDSMKWVQTSILKGTMTAAKWRERFQGSWWNQLLAKANGLYGDLAKLILLGASDELLQKIAKYAGFAAIGAIVAAVAFMAIEVAIVFLAVLDVLGTLPAFLGILQSAGIGAFLNSAAQVITNQIQINCGAKIGLFDGVPWQAASGALAGGGGAVGANFVAKQISKQVAYLGPIVTQNINTIVNNAGQAVAPAMSALNATSGILQNGGSVQTACGGGK